MIFLLFFSSLLLKDLYFVNEGCASKLPNGHLNMEKARALAEHVSQFMKWKDMECPYEKNSRILDYFERSAAYSSEALEFESYLCEPPDTPQDKDQYKSLKHSSKKSWRETLMWPKKISITNNFYGSITNPAELTT